MVSVRKSKAPRKAGRPPIEFNQRVADRFCEEIIDGKSMRRICKAKDMPSKKIILKWLQESEVFRAQYAQAREEQAEGYADELMELQRKANATNAHAIRVKADIIKWVCSKLKPKRFGDRVAIEADVRDTREPVDRESLLLETGRRVAYLIFGAGDLQRDRATQALLPAPAQQGAPAATSYETGEASNPSMKRNTEPAVDAAEQQAAPTAPATDQSERTVDYAGRLSESADAMQSMRTAEPLPIAANRYRPRSQRS